MSEKILLLGDRIDIELKAKTIQKVIEYLIKIPLQNKDAIIQDLKELIPIHEKLEDERKDLEFKAKIKSGEIFIADLEDIASQLGKHDRYNGGWFKTIIGINRASENGYSLKGDFVKDKTQLKEGTLILDCSIGGSRKNQTKKYAVIKVLSANKGELIAESEGKTWAIDLWDAIEKNLIKNQ